jgi:hypothetical protein
VRDPILCEFCGKSVVPTTGNQRTCPAKPCKRKLRAKTRSILYHSKRQEPICVWCEKPIREVGKRQYHTECRAEKNRQRVREYRKNKPKTQSSAPKKPRIYKDHLTCKYCKKRVRRTGARQFTCCSHECRLTRKRKVKERSQTKRDQRARQQEREKQAYYKRLAEVRAEKEQKHREARGFTSAYVPTSYRVVL